MPRTGLSSDQIKTRALEVALGQIRAQGFEKVRLTDVAHEMGISHAALYAHFENKEALLDSALEGWLAETTGALEVLCDSKRKPLQKLEGWFLVQYRMKRERARNDRAAYAAFVAASAAKKPVVCAYLEVRRAQLVALLEEIGASASDTGVLLNATASFLHPRLVLENADRDREPELKQLLRALFRGLGIS